MTENDSKAMRKAKYRRRVEYVMKDIGIADWSNQAMNRLLRRLSNIAGDELTGPDLRVVVRLYNRELIGRSKI